MEIFLWFLSTKGSTREQPLSPPRLEAPGSCVNGRRAPLWPCSQPRASDDLEHRSFFLKDSPSKPSLSSQPGSGRAMGLSIRVPCPGLRHRPGRRSEGRVPSGGQSLCWRAVRLLLQEAGPLCCFPACDSAAVRAGRRCLSLAGAPPPLPPPSFLTSSSPFLTPWGQSSLAYLKPSINTCRAFPGRGGAW